MTLQGRVWAKRQEAGATNGGKKTDPILRADVQRYNSEIEVVVAFGICVLFGVIVPIL